MRLCYDTGLDTDDAIAGVPGPPKKHAGGRKKVFTKEVRKRFLERMALGDRPTVAARNVGVGRSTMYRYVEQHPKFARKMHEARLPAIEILEDAAFKAAAEDRNPTMLIFMLANLASDRYRRDPDKAAILAAQINVGGVPVEWSVQDARGRLHEMVDELEAKRREHAEQAAIDAPSREVDDGR